MKKVLSLVLALSIALSLGITAFAVWEGTPERIVEENTLFPGAGEGGMVRKTYTGIQLGPLEFGHDAIINLTTDDSITDNASENGVVVVAANGQISAAGVVTVNVFYSTANITAGDELNTTIEFSDAAADPQTGTFTLTVIGTVQAAAGGEDPGEDPAPTGRIPNGVRISGLNTAYGVDDAVANNEVSGLKDPGAIYYPNEDVRIWLLAKCFTWVNANGQAVNPVAGGWGDAEVPGSMALSIGARVNVDGNRNYLSGSISRGATNTRLVLSFSNPYVSVLYTDFVARLSLLYNNSAPVTTVNKYVDIYGSLRNYEEDVWQGMNFVSTFDGIVRVANVRNVTIRDLRLQVSPFGDYVDLAVASANTKFYARMTSTAHPSGTSGVPLSDADRDILNRFSAVDSVYKFQQVNVDVALKGNAGAAGVYLASAPRGYFVYNEALDLIGTTNEKLPYSPTYYVARERVALKGEEVSEAPAPAPDLDPAAPSTGGAPSLPNANYNPNTGVI